MAMLTLVQRPGFRAFWLQTRSMFNVRCSAPDAHPDQGNSKTGNPGL